MVRFLSACAISLLLCGTGIAQPAPAEGWQLTLGAGTIYSPSYEGDDDYSLKIVPNVQVHYGERFFASVQEGVGYNLLKQDGWRAGPIGRIRFSRKEDGNQSFALNGGKTDDLRGLGDVDTSIELGAFAEYEIGPITLGAELRQAVSGHDALVADFGARWGGRTGAFGPPVIWSVGPRLRLADDQYTSTYFGITSPQSAASGLPEYDAGGGVHSYGIGAVAIMPLDREGRWNAVFLAGYDRLSGDAGNSPLVQLRGNADQATFGVFASYTFR